MLRTLTQSQRRRYRDEGIVFPFRVLDEGEACRFRTQCDDLEQQLGGKPRTIAVRQMHLHFPWAWELATHPCVLDAVEDLLGPDLLVWATELFSKHPHDSVISIGWHRDRPYMGFSSQETATAWIALSDCTPENGCLRAQPGVDHVAAVLDERRVIDVELRAGEMSLHDADILHGSGSNCSDHKRVGFAIRFVTPAARALHGRPQVALARGNPPADGFQIVEPPSESQSADALAAMKKSAAAHFDSVLENLQTART